MTTGPDACSPSYLFISSYAELEGHVFMVAGKRLIDIFSRNPVKIALAAKHAQLHPLSEGGIPFDVSPGLGWENPASILVSRASSRRKAAETGMAKFIVPWYT